MKIDGKADMRDLFKDILNMEGVKGLMMFSFTGDPIFKEFNQAQPDGIDSRDWSLFIESLAGMRETDLIFKKGRLYIRRTEIGYLVVLMGLFVPIAMMRLQCDILLPSLKPVKAAKGIRRLFKK
jgi:hypothetical protein